MNAVTESKTDTQKADMEAKEYHAPKSKRKLKPRENEALIMRQKCAADEEEENEIIVKLTKIKVDNEGESRVLISSTDSRDDQSGGRNDEEVRKPSFRKT